MHILFLKNYEHLNNFIGYTDEEIEEVTFLFEWELPKILLEFWKMFGQNFFSKLPGPDINGFEYMKVVYPTLTENIELNKAIYMDLTFRVILCIQDNNFWFINVYDGDNPPVYFYKTYPDKIEIVKIFENFTSMLDICIQHMID